MKITFGLLAALLLAGTGPVAAQVPDEFTNLKVLPTDIQKRGLLNVMRAFSEALGVRCTHCHVGKVPGSLEGVDFASDELEPKRVARAMMIMTGEINNELLPATGRESLVRVRCITCHRGLTRPESLDLILLEVIDEQDVDAAVRKYRELRAEYFGTGAYDFGPATLAAVAQVLAQERGDLDGALTLLKLNAEVDPDQAAIHLLMGQVYAMRGDNDAARASVERALKLDPGNELAKQVLERLPSSE